ncbi:MAG TPA: DUF885 domain-containing protein [Steroidobacteraceae bacterium]|nr:DUF885 domain-containing protein [Steroidobacteraceae bacterium]
MLPASVDRIRLVTAVAALLVSGLGGGRALAQAPAPPPAPAAPAAAPVPRPRAPVAQPVQKHPWEDARFAQVEHDYLVYFLGRFPVVATYLGAAALDPQLAGVDGRLRDYSPEALRAEDVQLAEFRMRFAHLAPAGLSPRRRIDRSVALAEIAFLEHLHTVRRHQQSSLDSYVDEPVRGIDWQIQGMTQTGGAGYGTDGEWQSVIARVRAVPAYLATAERQLAAGVTAHNTPDARVLADFGLKSATADADYFGSTLPQLAGGAIASAQRPVLMHDLAAAGEAAASAYRHLAAMVSGVFFEEGSGGEPRLKAEFRADRFALGETEYDWALRNNLRLTSSAAELYAQSWPAVETVRAEMIQLAREIAASHQWPRVAEGAGVVRAVLEQLSRNAPQSDAEMLEGYRRAGARIVAYARATGLFEVPAEYRLEVLATPPPLRASIANGAYYPAPPFRQSGVGRLYITPTGDDAAALRSQHDYASMPVLAAHEGFPGHDWHFKVMTQYREEISAVRWLLPGAVEDSSSMWQDSMATEGWALYSEALLAEAARGAPHGLYTPEERLYQLRGRLLRELRVRIDTGIHTGRMRFEEAVTLYSEVVDFLPGSCQDAASSRSELKQASCNAARAAITRYARWPTQAITYRTGKEQILSLRRRAQLELGARYAPQRFHLELMKEGTIPAGYFGEELLRTLRTR